MGIIPVRRRTRPAPRPRDTDPGRLPELLVLVCSVVAAAVALAQPLVLGRTLDLLLHDGSAGVWLMASAALLVGEVLLDGLTALFTGRCTADWTAAVRSRALTGMLHAVPDLAGRYSPGDVATRLTLNASDAGGLPATRAALAASLVVPAGALVALAVVDVWVAACVLAGLPALVLLLRAFAHDTGASVRAYQRVQSDIAARLLETTDGAETIAAAGTAVRERERVLTPLTELAGLGRRMWVLHGRALATGGVLVPLLTLAATAVGGLRLGAGALSVGELLAVVRYAQLTAGFGSAATLLGALVRGRSARERTTALEQLPALPCGTRTLPPDGPGALELRGVRVRRDGAEVLRVDHVVVPGGLTAAVVGRTGAGKSVLAAVAGRLIDPDEGEVLLDGTPLDRLTRPCLRAEVGFAFARPVLAEGTVAEAVAAGPRSVSPRRIRQALRVAGADTFVRRLPGGYDTPLADAPLSGGEYQRLGLARAFAHAGRLLVMDDATSSLDTVTEHAVDQALRRSLGTATRLVVAHRPSVAVRADLVIWLEGGRVRAVGPHRRLWTEAAYRAVFATGEHGTVSLGTEAGTVASGAEDGAVALGTEDGTVASGAEDGAVALGAEDGTVASGAEDGSVALGSEAGTVASGAEDGSVALGSEAGAVPPGTGHGTVPLGTGDGDGLRRGGMPSARGKVRP